jgi:hypothetical protein
MSLMMKFTCSYDLRIVQEFEEVCTVFYLLLLVVSGMRRLARILINSRNSHLVRLEDDILILGPLNSSTTSFGRIEREAKRALPY